MAYRSKAAHAAYMRKYREGKPRVYDEAARARVKAMMAADTPERKAARRARRQAKQKRRYHEDEEFRRKQIDAQQARIRQLRAAIVAAYGSMCACCGEDEYLFLEIDHVNGGGNKDFRENNVATVYRRIIAEGFPADYRILCANCNKGRERNGGVCPHVTKRR